MKEETAQIELTHNEIYDLINLINVIEDIADRFSSDCDWCFRDIKKRLIQAQAKLDKGES